MVSSLAPGRQTLGLPEDDFHLMKLFIRIIEGEENEGI